MRKLTFFFATACLFFISCQKLEIIDKTISDQENSGCDTDIINSSIESKSETKSNFQNSFETVEVVNGRIKFKNEINFQKAIDFLKDKTSEELDEWEQSIGFTSMRSVYKPNPEDRPIETDLMATVLNGDGIVQIGRHAFNVDKANERVYVLFEPTENGIALLKLRNEVPNSIVYYSTAEDVLSIIQTGGNPTPAGSENCYRGDSKEKNAPEYTYENKTYRLKMRIKYYKYGINHHLVSTMEHQYKKSIGWGNAATTMGLSASFTIKPKNKPAISGTNAIYYPAGYYGSYLETMIYANSRCLSQAGVSATYQYKRYGAPYTTTETLSVSWY